MMILCSCTGDDFDTTPEITLVETIQGTDKTEVISTGAGQLEPMYHNYELLNAGGYCSIFDYVVNIV